MRSAAAISGPSAFLRLDALPVPIGFEAFEVAPQGRAVGTGA